MKAFIFAILALFALSACSTASSGKLHKKDIAEKTQIKKNESLTGAR